VKISIRQKKPGGGHHDLILRLVQADRNVKGFGTFRADGGKCVGKGGIITSIFTF